MQDTVKLQEVDKGSLECREGSSGVAAFCDRRSAILNDLYICLNRGNFLWRQKERSNMFKVIWTKWKRGIGFLFFTIFVFIVEEEEDGGGAAGRGGFTLHVQTFVCPHYLYLWDAFHPNCWSLANINYLLCIAWVAEEKVDFHFPYSLHINKSVPTYRQTDTNRYVFRNA